MERALVLTMIRSVRQGSTAEKAGPAARAMPKAMHIHTFETFYAEKTGGGEKGSLPLKKKFAAENKVCRWKKMPLNLPESEQFAAEQSLSLKKVCR